jgi:hypothetical protein
MGGRFPVRFPEKLVEYLFAGGTLSEIPEYVATHFAWHRSAVTERSQCSEGTSHWPFTSNGKKPVRFLMSMGGGLG